MSLVEDVRPSSRTSPSTCWKIKYSSRSDTAEIMPGRPRPSITAGQGPGLSIVEPHRPRYARDERAGPSPSNAATRRGGRVLAAVAGAYLTSRRAVGGNSDASLV